MKQKITIVLALACLCLLGYCGCSQNNSQDDSQNNAQNNESSGESVEGAVEPQTAIIDEKLIVPTGATLEELETFLAEAQRYLPTTIKTYEEYQAFMAQKCEAINKAVDLILAMDDLPAASKRRALSMRLWTCLQCLDGEAAIGKSMKSAQNVIDENKDNEEMASVLFTAQRTLLTLRMVTFSRDMNTNRDEFMQLDKDLCEFYGDLDKQMFTSPATTMLEIASSLYAGEDNFHEALDELAAKYTTMLLVTEAGRMPAKLRRFKLPGSEMEFQTVTIDVKKLVADAADTENFDVMAWVKEQPVEKLDLKSLKGKVVLIDFWVTWCGPCLAEIPNMLEQYEKYHDKGFEIIGYSSDQYLGDLLNFLIKEQPPWIIGSTVLSAREELMHFMNYYGISTIPTMILVGRDGKVISIEAYGETLNKLLEEQFKE